MSEKKKRFLQEEEQLKMISDEKIGEIIEVLSTPDSYVLFDKEKEVFKVFIKEYLDCDVEWLNQSLEKLGVKVKLECIHFINDSLITCVMCYMFSYEDFRDDNNE